MSWSMAVSTAASVQHCAEEMPALGLSDGDPKELLAERLRNYCGSPPETMGRVALDVCRARKFILFGV